MGRILAAALTVALGAALPPVPADAAPASWSRVADRQDQGHGLISRDRAAEIARAATGGRVLRVQLHGGATPRYRVRVLIDGERVRSIRIDGRSGRVLD